MHEEEQHIDIRVKLLNLPKVKASDDFMNALQRKINLADAEVNQKKITDDVKESIWVKLFGKNRNPWLIPSLSLTIVVIFVVSVYILNSGKLTEVPTMSDFQKKEKNQDIVMQDKQNTTEQPEELNEKNGRILNKQESEKNLEKSPPATEKELYKHIENQSVSPNVNNDGIGAPPVPKKMDDMRIETGKSEQKKEDKINQEFDNSVREEKIDSKKGNLKANEPKSIIKDEEKSETKDNKESKGLIDQKEKMTMKKSAKSTTDSTKIDKKVLEKIKEELEKTLDEK
ncbi:MAG: hypothetical protein WC358_07820 [Ignavibacteria bacterium]